MSEWAVMESRSGPPATAVRFGNRPAPSAGRHLTGQKGFPGRPLRSPSRGYFYKLRASRSVVVNLSLSRRNAASESKERAAARGSWFVSPHHHTRRGCDGISLADSPRASPYEQSLPPFMLPGLPESDTGTA